MAAWPGELGKAFFFAKFMTHYVIINPFSSPKSEVLVPFLTFSHLQTHRELRWVCEENRIE